MNLLPGADYSRLISDLLSDACEWSKEVMPASSCPTEGPCEAHPDPVECSKIAHGVSYIVNDGPLKGTWCASGSSAENVIFDRMIASLDDGWRAALSEFRVIATMMRRVGR